MAVLEFLVYAMLAIFLNFVIKADFFWGWVGGLAEEQPRV